MSSQNPQKKDGPSSDPLPEQEPLDRLSYLKNIRAGLLRKLGLPEDTRPEQVVRLLKIKETLLKIEAAKSRKH